jgi:VWFA-related protein
MGRVLALVAACFCAVPVFSQDSRFGASVEVSIVNVDVVVTDRSGNRVRGLTAADFEILENGKPQPITNFTEFRGDASTRIVQAQGSAPATAAAAAAPDVAPPQKRTMVIFIDRLAVHGRERARLFGELKSFLRKNVRPGDAVAITSFASAPTTRQDFTDDVPRLEASLDALAAEKSQRVESSKWVALDFERRQIEWLYAVANKSGEDVGTTVGEYSAAAQVVLDVRQKARALDAIMHAMAGASGQKILVMFTNRFAGNSGAEYTGIGSTMTVTADLQIAQMVATAKANNVRIYPLYAKIGDMDVGDTTAQNGPAALESGVKQSNLRNMEAVSLTSIANETGGVAGTGLGDLDKLFTSVTEDLSSYYSLAYRATPEGGGKRLALRVNNPAYRVRTRRDVVDKSSETLTRERIIASLLDPPKIEGMPVNVFLAKARVNKGIIHLPLQIRVPVTALTLLPDGAKRSGGFSVYVGWAGELGTFGDVAKREHPVSLDPSQIKAGETILAEIEVAATRSVNRLVVAVVDDLSQEMGLVRFDMPKPKAR